MQIDEILKNTELPLAESEIILAHCLKKNRTWIIAHPKNVVEKRQREEFCAKVKQRKRGMPIAYIEGEKEWYGRSFSVSPHVLIPRPCTEMLIDTTLELVQNNKCGIKTIDNNIVALSLAKQSRKKEHIHTIVDIGTGCGAIAITLALLTKKFRIIATDISPSAMLIAQKNARRYKVKKKIQWHIGDGGTPIKGLRKPFIMVTNPPYIPRKGIVEKNVRKFEPSLALFGGNDGLAVLRKILSAYHEHPLCRGIVIECREDQVDALKNLYP